MEDILHKKRFYAMKRLEEIYKSLRSNSSRITLSNIGAGSKKLKNKTASVASIAKVSGSPLKYAKLLFRLSNRFNPKYTLELGTSLGISTMFIAAPNPENKVFSLEGNPDVAKKARDNIHAAGLKNVTVLDGIFSERLPSVLEKLPKLDFVFIDGDHRFIPTMKYIDLILPKIHNDSVLILDDIHWSAEMEQAWKEVKQLPQVTVTVDLFKVGLVFFRKEQVREDFILRF